MKVIIDRIENDIAVVELPDNSVLNVPAKLFENVCEGAVYEIIHKNGNEEKEQIKKLMENVWED